MKKRVLIFLNRLVIGGVAQDIVSLAYYLQQDFDILIVVGRKNEDEETADTWLNDYPGLQVEEIPVLKRSMGWWSDWKAYRQVKKIIQRYRPHIVHTHGTKPGIIGRLVARRQNVPVILHTYHGHVFHSYFNPFVSSLLIRLDRWLASFSTRIIAISISQKKELAQQYKIAPAEKIQCIPLGVEIEKFTHTAEARKRFRKKYFLQDDEIAVGIIGRIVPVKNHVFFIKAVKELIEEQPSLRVFIVGDGKAREELEDYLDEQQIAHTFFPRNPIISPVTFTSWQTQIEEVIAGLDIIALSSLNEGTPLSLMEAQAAGKPVVATQAGGVAEIMQDQGSGYLIEQGNLLKYQQKLRLLIENDHIRQKMGTHGRQFIAGRFSKQQEVAAHRQLYARLAP